MVLNPTRSRGIPVFALIGGVLAASPAPLVGSEMVTNFSPSEFQSMQWEIEDDRVMGGISQGHVRLEEDRLIFHGELSLERNGGFSSVQSGRLDLNLGGADGLELRVKGDGRTYQLHVGTDETYRGREMAFAAPFTTMDEEWTEVRVPFHSLVGTSRGRNLKDKIFDPANIRRLRVLLGDGKPRSFELEIDWIRSYSIGSG